MLNQSEDAWIKIVICFHNIDVIRMFNTCNAIKTIFETVSNGVKLPFLVMAK
jgi:hypothetical protein